MTSKAITISKWKWGLGLLTLILLLYFLLSSTSSKQNPLDLKIILTCDTNGRIEPCGCFTGQFGGLTRLATQLHSLHGRQIRLDAGDALAGERDDQIIKHKYVLKTFEHLDYSALNLGAKEAALSLQELNSLIASTTIPYVSANLKSLSPEPLKSKKFITLSLEHLNIGITGVVDSQLLEHQIGSDLGVEPMSLALSGILPELKKTCDVIIVLAFCSEKKMRELADQFHEINFILGGSVRQPSQNIELVNRSYLAYTTGLSKNYLSIDLQINSNRIISEPTFEVQLLEQTISESKEVLLHNTNYRKEIAQTELKIDRFIDQDDQIIPGQLQKHKYVGSQACAGCHPTAFKKFASSAHAKAFKTLQYKGADMDPNCIKCHTVGFGKPGGYERVFKGSQLAHVGCESCHGPGGDHVEQRTTGMTAWTQMRPLGKGSCVKCHYGEFSRPFVWEKFWPAIAHGKEGEAP